MYGRSLTLAYLRSPSSASTRALFFIFCVFLCVICVCTHACPVGICFHPFPSLSWPTTARTCLAYLSEVFVALPMFVVCLLVLKGCRCFVFFFLCVLFPLRRCSLDKRLTSRERKLPPSLSHLAHRLSTVTRFDVPDSWLSSVSVQCMPEMLSPTTDTIMGIAGFLDWEGGGKG